MAQQNISFSVQTPTGLAEKVKNSTGLPEIITQISRSDTVLSNKTFNMDDDVWVDLTKIFDTILFCLACAAVIFNLLNVWAIISAKLHLKMTYRLVISLSLSDVVIALVFCITYISKKYLVGETKTIVDMILFNIYHIGSMACVLTLTAVSADLFVQNILPYKYSTLHQVFKIFLAISWIVPIFLTEGVQVGVTLSNKWNNETFLDTYFRVRDNSLGYINFSLAVICLLIIIGLNLKTLRSVYKLLKRSPQEGQSLKKSAITILAIVVTYVLFYLPTWIVGILFVLHFRFRVLVLQSLTISQRSFLIAIFSQLKILNSLSDPLIYAFRISVIRKHYTKLLRLKCWKLNYVSDVERNTDRTYRH